MAKRGGRADGPAAAFLPSNNTADNDQRIPIEHSIPQLEHDEDFPTSKEALVDLAAEFKAAMEDAARALDFEEAARLRDRLMTVRDRLDDAGID